MATRRPASRKKTTRKKKGGFWKGVAAAVAAPFRWWDDIADAAHTVKKARAGHLKRAGARAKERPVLDATAAAGRVAREVEKARRKAARDAEIAEEDRLAAERAQVKRQGKTRQGSPAGGEVVVGQVASLCAQPTADGTRCQNLVLPGTPECAAGHPQGGSSFGGPRPGQRPVNQHDPQPQWWTRDGTA
jgi:hypothetical protein